MKKRILSALLVVVMVMTMVPTALAAGYVDVAADAWYEDAVDYVTRKGLMNGTGDNTFSPNQSTTRGMVVTVLWRMEGEPYALGNSFTDVAAGAYYADAVEWASDNGIVTGYGNGAFGPNNVVTREQLVSILYRYAGKCGLSTKNAADLTAFADYGSVSSYAVRAMEWAVAVDLINGMGGNLAPQGTATRAQVATMLMRFHKLLGVGGGFVSALDYIKACHDEVEFVSNEDGTHNVYCECGKLLAVEDCEYVDGVCKKCLVSAVDADMVAVIDGVYYDDLQEALNAAKNGETVKLVADVESEETITVPEGCNAVLDLNGKTLTGSILAPDATLTVKNGSIVNNDSDASAIEINDGELNLEDVDITSARHAVRIDGPVTATIDGGTYTLIPTAGKTQHALNVSGAADVTVKDGTFVGPKGTVSDSGAAVNAQEGSKVTIEGGNFSGGKNNTLSAKGTLTVTGGTYDQDPGAYVAEDYSATENEDGTYTVVGCTVDESGNVEIVDAAGLKYFRDQVNAGNTYKGKTVKLGADIDLNNEAWTPIGDSANKFQGTFDGQNNTISNLLVEMESKSNVGLFGFTTDGEVKNLTVENAKVTGRLNVGVVAGTPYTSKYTNIKVTGHVEVNGMAYVGGVGGKNAYANWTDITVDVDDTSYVNANSVENGTAYRTYVGGVIGFMGEGGHTVKNVTSNIDVIGSTCDVGGIVGIAHYNNKFENCSASCSVSITSAAEEAAAEEIGGIAGVWHNESGTSVTFTNCEFEGSLSTNVAADLSDNTITGKAYSATGTGKLIIDGAVLTNDVAAIAEILASGGDITLTSDVETEASTTAPYSNKLAFVLNGGVLDGNGNTLSVECYGDDYAIMTSGGTIKNLTIDAGCRAIMIMSPTKDIILDNVYICGDVLYPINTGEHPTEDGIDLVVTESSFGGWTSFAGIASASFTDCAFIEGDYGYSWPYETLVKPYINTLFEGCNFAEGYYLDLSALEEGCVVTLKDCMVNGTKITADLCGFACDGTEVFCVELPTGRELTDCVIFE